MNIAHLGITSADEGLPVISKAVVRGDMIYLCGVSPDPVGDIAAQTQQVLDRIDRLLASAGSGKSKLLTAQVWLADMRHFDEHNAVWNKWVDHDNPPARACVGAPQWRPGLLVEIMATASR
jgi:enamine deaminase RidA (YjgF/YER057c/UK114 family)